MRGSFDSTPPPPAVSRDGRAQDRSDEGGARAQYALLRLAIALSLRAAASAVCPRWLREAAGCRAGAPPPTWEQAAALLGEWPGVAGDAGAPKRSLLPVHVFALANAARRPVIVYGATAFEGVRYPWHVALCGVYLPLLHEPTVCWRSPLLLGYTRGHFSGVLLRGDEAGAAAAVAGAVGGCMTGSADEAPAWAADAAFAAVARCEAALSASATARALPDGPPPSADGATEGVAAPAAPAAPPTPDVDVPAASGADDAAWRAAITAAAAGDAAGVASFVAAHPGASLTRTVTQADIGALAAAAAAAAAGAAPRALGVGQSLGDVAVAAEAWGVLDALAPPGESPERKRSASQADEAAAAAAAALRAATMAFLEVPPVSLPLSAVRLDAATEATAGDDDSWARARLSWKDAVVTVAAATVEVAAVDGAWAVTLDLASLDLRPPPCADAAHGGVVAVLSPLPHGNPGGSGDGGGRGGGGGGGCTVALRLRPAYYGVDPTDAFATLYERRALARLQRTEAAVAAGARTALVAAPARQGYAPLVDAAGQLLPVRMADGEGIAGLTALLLRCHCPSPPHTHIPCHRAAAHRPVNQLR